MANQHEFNHIQFRTIRGLTFRDLNEDHAGPPVYITKQLTAEQRTQYGHELKLLAVDVRKLVADVPEKGRMQRISRCLENVMGDLEERKAGSAPGNSPRAMFQNLIPTRLRKVAMELLFSGS